MDDTRLYARRDSTAGPLNDRGAWPSTHLPILGRAGDLTGRKRSRCHVRWTDVLERRQRRQLHYRDPSVSLLSPVIENHVKGQLCDTGCPSLQVVPSSQNMTKTTLDWMTAFCCNYRLFSYGCPCNDDICKHSQWINLHIQRGVGHLLEAMNRGPWEKPNHWVHYTDTVMTFGLQM